MNSTADEDVLTNTTSITREEAVLRLLGMPNYYLRQVWLSHSDNPEGGEYVGHILYEIVQEEFDAAESAYFTAKREKHSVEIVAEKLAELERCKLQNANYERFNCDIVDELNKLDDSELRIDKFSTINPVDPFITITSFNQWAMRYKTIDKRTNGPNSGLQDQSKPWLIAEPQDTPPQWPWFTPARYFARHHLKENPLLKGKTNLLAVKVTESLTHAGILKRGNKPFNPATVIKAFSNCNLGETLELSPKVPPQTRV